MFCSSSGPPKAVASHVEAFFSRCHLREEACHQKPNQRDTSYVEHIVGQLEGGIALPVELNPVAMCHLSFSGP